MYNINCEMCNCSKPKEFFKCDLIPLNINSIKKCGFRKPETLAEIFLHENYKNGYIQYLNSLNKESYPRLGNLVISLRSGFSSAYPGVLMKVTEIDGDDIALKRFPIDEDDITEYGITKNNWFEYVMKIVLKEEEEKI